MNQFTLRNLRHLWLRTTAFGDGARLDVLRNLLAMNDAGIALYETLSQMAKVFAEEKDRRAYILRDMSRRLERGELAADALRPWLAEHEVAILDASKRNVSMSEALRSAVGLTETRNAIVGEIVGAMAYPAVLIVVGVAMQWVFATQAIPILAQLIPAERWGGLGALYYATSTAIRDHGLWLLLGSLAGLGAVLYSLPRWKPGRLRSFLDRWLPPYNLYRVYNSAVLLISLATMIRAGIPMADAVDILWRNATPWLRRHLDDIRRKLNQGSGVRLTALRHQVFERDVRIAIDLFDRHGEPEKSMKVLGQQAGESARRAARKIGATANVLVLLAVALVMVGFVAAVLSVVMQFQSQAGLGR